MWQSLARTQPIPVVEEEEEEVQDEVQEEVQEEIQEEEEEIPPPVLHALSLIHTLSLSLDARSLSLSL